MYRKASKCTTCHSSSEPSDEDEFLETDRTSFDLRRRRSFPINKQTFSVDTRRRVSLPLQHFMPENAVSDGIRNSRRRFKENDSKTSIRSKTMSDEKLEYRTSRFGSERQRENVDGFRFNIGKWDNCQVDKSEYFVHRSASNGYSGSERNEFYFDTRRRRSLPHYQTTFLGHRDTEKVLGRRSMYPVVNSSDKVEEDGSGLWKTLRWVKDVASQQLDAVGESVSSLGNTVWKCSTEESRFVSELIDTQPSFKSIHKNSSSNEDNSRNEKVIHEPIDWSKYPQSAYIKPSQLMRSTSHDKIKHIHDNEKQSNNHNCASPADLTTDEDEDKRKSDEDDEKERFFERKRSDEDDKRTNKKGGALRKKSKKEANEDY